VSLHAVGQRGTLPLGWSLYLPEEWCDDYERRRRAKIPGRVAFQTEPQLARDLIGQVAIWEVPRGPILADSAYGDDGDFSVGLDDERLSYVVAISSGISVHEPDTEFTIPERASVIGRPPSVARADRAPCSVAELAARLREDAFETLALAETVDGRPRKSRFACLRIFAASEIRRRHRTPRSEWLVIEWPPGAEAPSDYWLSNLPAGSLNRQPPLTRLAQMRNNAPGSYS
jgi:SRSO17 transposase